MWFICLVGIGGYIASILAIGKFLSLFNRSTPYEEQLDAKNYYGSLQGNNKITYWTKIDKRLLPMQAYRIYADEVGYGNCEHCNAIAGMPYGDFMELTIEGYEVLKICDSCKAYVKELLKGEMVVDNYKI